MTNRYKLRQHLISLGDDFTIEDEHGRAVYHVDNKLLRIRDTFVITDAAGREAATIRERMLALRDTVDICAAAKPSPPFAKPGLPPCAISSALMLKAGPIW